MRPCFVIPAQAGIHWSRLVETKTIPDDCDGGKVRVLFLTQVLPYPLVGGAKIRAYYMLRYLAQAHEVTLVSFVRDDDRPEDVAHLRQFCAAVHTVPLRRSRWQDGAALLQSVGRRQPVVIVRDDVAALRRLLRQLAQATPFDRVHADQTAMAQYGLWVQAVAGEKRPFTILDQHNAMYVLVGRQAALERGARRWLWQREARLLARYEADLCRRYDHVLTVTAEDKAALLRLLSAQEQVALANKFTPLPICGDPLERPLLPLADEGPHIIHLGTMFWPPNVEGVLWFAREVLPLILRQTPAAHFTIVGKNPPPEVWALAGPGAPLAGNISVTGFVEDPAPLLARSRVFIVPVRAGGGMRVKIIDGWQWGLPIVSTTLGAEGVATRPGENILLADDPAEFATAVGQLLGDKGLRERLRENGRAWVETTYNWRTVYAQLDNLYTPGAPARSPRRPSLAIY